MLRRISLGLMVVIFASWFSAKPTAAGIPGGTLTAFGTTYTTTGVFNCPTSDGGMVTVINMSGGGGTVVISILTPGS
jgi:hypothetical protein